MLHQYLANLDQTDSQHVHHYEVHIVCGDGRLFTAFRQEMSVSNTFLENHMHQFSTRTTDPGLQCIKTCKCIFI